MTKIEWTDEYINRLNKRDIEIEESERKFKEYARSHRSEIRRWKQILNNIPLGGVR